MFAGVLSEQMPLNCCSLNCSLSFCFLVSSAIGIGLATSLLGSSRGLFRSLFLTALLLWLKAGLQKLLDVLVFYLQEAISSCKKAFQMQYVFEDLLQ